MLRRERGEVSVAGVNAAGVSVDDLDDCDQWANAICACKTTVSVGASMKALRGPSVPSCLRTVGS